MPEKNPFFGATFAERKAIREAADKGAPKAKAVDSETEQVEDKAVTAKRATRKRAAKKS